MDLPSKASVTVEVYNTLGQKVQTVERSMAAGAGQTIRVDGSKLASGQYFYRVSTEADGETVQKTGRMTVVR
jgi:flagellar hook assembly protein FlgD